MLAFSWNKLDKDRVPVLSADDMDMLAEHLIDDYKPDLLTEAQPIDFEHFISFYLGLEIDYRDLRSSNPNEDILRQKGNGCLNGITKNGC